MKLIEGNTVPKDGKWYMIVDGDMGGAKTMAYRATDWLGVDGEYWESGDEEITSSFIFLFSDEQQEKINNQWGWTQTGWKQDKCS